MAPEVLIVGAGLAGLCCARRLAQTTTPFLILEATDGVGGRVRTDRYEGFLLDRGFQVFLTSYPEAQRVLDYDALDLRRFYPGAMVHLGQRRFRRIADPVRKPVDALLSLFAPLGTWGDLLRLGLMRERLMQSRPDDAWARPEGLTLDYLRAEVGLTEGFIDRFMKPFFGGVFFDRELKTSSRLFRYLFRMFSSGWATVPNSGMGAIPKQLADRLPADSVRLNAEVTGIDGQTVVLRSGERLTARAIVVATEGPVASRLLGEPAVPMPKSRAVTCLYFAADRSPFRQPYLLLNGTGTGRVNNVSFVSDAAPGYAPAGQSLVSVTVLGEATEDDATLSRLVQTELGEWFGEAAARWRWLRTYRIPHAQPDQTAGALDPARRPVQVRAGLYVCGDHRDNASIDGAMTSGWRTAQAVLSELNAR